MTQAVLQPELASATTLDPRLTTTKTRTRAVARGVHPRARRFVFTAAGAYIFGIAAFVAFSAYVNPWGNFGPVGYHTVINSRFTKVKYFDKLAPENRPQVVVMGASPAIRMKPATITRLMNKTAFNYCLFWGRTDDMLCLARHWISDLNYHPELIIVALDTWAFSPLLHKRPVFQEARRDLLNLPEMARHHPEVNAVKLAWAKFIDCFSRQHFEHSWGALLNEQVSRQGYPSLAESRAFDLDGTCVQYSWPTPGELTEGGSHRDPDVEGDGDPVFTMTEAGVYPVERLLQDFVDRGVGNKIAYYPHYDFDGLWDKRISYFEQFVQLCTEQGIKLVFVLNPLQPIFLDVLTKHTPHLENLAELRTLVERLSAECPNVLGVVDMSRLESFGGKPADFYDECHYATRNADLILQRVAALVNGS